MEESPTTGGAVLRHVGEIDTGGKALELSGIAIYRVTDGKISESWHYTNVIDVLLQHHPEARAGGLTDGLTHRLNREGSASWPRRLARGRGDRWRPPGPGGC
ncbi:MAG: hypothetical protein ACRDJU_15490 [Actinomycetota bacterium]